MGKNKASKVKVAVIAGDPVTAEDPKVPAIDDKVEQENEASSGILKYFWDLASTEAEDRQNATINLISELSIRQSAYMASLSGSQEFLEFGLTENAESHTFELTGDCEKFTEDALKLICHQEVHYALNRLVRGLNSPRQGARQGFSLALTELITSVLMPFTPCHILFRIINRHTETTGSMKGTEERDIIFGRVFGYMALIQSGLVASVKNSRLVDIQDIITHVMDQAVKKTYLREWAFEVLHSMLKYPGAQFLTETCDFMMSQELGLVDCEPSAELLLLSLAIESINEEQGAIMASSMKLMRHCKILDPKNFAVIAEIMRESATAHPRVHCAWKYVIDTVFSQSTPTDAHHPIQRFWRIVIDESLFSSTHTKKFLGFRLFEMVLMKLVDAQMPASFVFTPQFIGCLLDNASTTDNNLHKAAQHAISMLLQLSETNKDVALQFVAAIGGKSSSSSLQDVRKFVKNKAILDKFLAAGLGGEGDETIAQVCSHVDWIIASFTIYDVTPSEDTTEESVEDVQKTIDTHRRWCADQLLSLVKNDRIAKHDSWLQKVVQFFIFHSFYVVESSEAVIKHELLAQMTMCTPKLSNSLQNVMRQKTWSLITELVLRRKDYSTTDWLSKAVEFHVQLVNIIQAGTKTSKKKSKSLVDAGFVAICSEWSSDITETVRATETQIQQFTTSTEDPKKQKKVAVFRQLLCLVYFQAVVSLDDEEVGELASVLDEVLQCFTEWSKPDWSEQSLNPVSVLTDVLVSLLAKQQAPIDTADEQVVKSSGASSIRLTRHIVENVFRTLCTDIDNIGMNALFKVIDPVVAAQSGDFEMVDDNESDDAESDSDFEMEEEEVDTAEADAKMNEAIKEALGKAAVGDESEDDSDLLNDDQMFELGFDSKLAEIFRNRKIEKNQRRDVVQFVSDFKFRVLDLMEIMARQLQTSQDSENAKRISELALSMSLALIRSSIVHANPSAASSDKKQAKNDDDEDFAAAFAQQVATSVIELSTEQRTMMVSKMSATIKNRLCKVQLKSVEAADLERQLDTVVQIICGEYVIDGVSFPAPSKEVLPPVVEIALWLIRAILSSSPSMATVSKIKSLMRTKLIPLHISKSGKAHLPASFFVDFARRNVATTTKSLWETLGQTLVDILINRHLEDTPVNSYQQFQIWHILSSVVKVSDASDSWWESNVLFPLAKLSQLTLKNLAATDVNFKAPRVKEILAVIGDILRKVKKNNIVEFEKNFVVLDLPKLLDAVMAVPAWSSAGAIQNMCRQMTLLFEVKEKSATVEVTDVPVVKVAKQKRTAGEDKQFKKKVKVAKA